MLYIPFPHICIATPTINISPQNGTVVTVGEPILTCYYPPFTLVFTLGFTLGVVHSVDFDKNIIMCIYHYSIIWNSFTVLKILYALPIHPSLPLSPCPPTDLFTISIVFPFSECHVVGVIQYVAFSD